MSESPFATRPRRPDGAPLDFTTFWSILGRLVLRLNHDRAHAQIVISLHEGKLTLIEVNRKYLPANIPEV